MKFVSWKFLQSDRLKILTLNQGPESSHLTKWPGPEKACVLNGMQFSLRRARQWYDWCCELHDDCRSEALACTPPSRLIDVSTIYKHDVAGIRLIKTNAGRTYSYACLSHRWDDHVKATQTTIANLDRRSNFLELASLPQTMQDAVRIVQDLAVPFLWIDSLCIVQDESNQVELSQELAKMGSIYGEADLTIAAASSQDSSLGCFSHNRWPDICFEITLPGIEKHLLLGARVLDRKTQHHLSQAMVDERYPLYCRAWFMQESLHSRRMLICNYGEFEYRCMSAQLCECRNDHLLPHVKDSKGTHWLGAMEPMDSLVFKIRDYGAFSTSISGGIMMDATYLRHVWNSIVSTYIRLDISFPSDDLPAIGGCAAKIGDQLDDEYMAGMWRSSLPDDMLWHIAMSQESGNQATCRPAEWRAPSWSWASLRMGRFTRIRQMDTDLLTNVWDIHHTSWSESVNHLKSAISSVQCQPEAAANPYGRVMRGAHLVIKAPLYRWDARLLCPTAGLLQDAKRKCFSLAISEVDASLCTSKHSQIDFPGKFRIELYPDEDIMTWPNRKTPDCSEEHEKHACTLVELQMLRAVEKTDPKFSFDVFLLLRESEDASDLLKSYSRVGLLYVWSEKANGQTWLDFMGGKMKVRDDEFLFILV